MTAINSQQRTFIFAPSFLIGWTVLLPGQLPVGRGHLGCCREGVEGAGSSGKFSAEMIYLL